MGGSLRSLLFLLIVAWVALRHALAAVKEVSSMTINNVLATSTKPVLVEFYSPECPHCQELEPVLEEVSQLLKKQLNVVRLDMRTTYETNRFFSVRASPTLMLYKKEDVGAVEVPHARQDLAAFRDAKAMASYILMHLGEDVQPLQSYEELQALVGKLGSVMLGLLPPQYTAESKLFAAVAKELRRYNRFLSVTDEDEALQYAEKLGVQPLPAIVAVRHKDVSVRYEGDLTEASLQEFVSTQGLPLLGYMNALTYSRYKYLNETKVMLVYSPEDRKRVQEAEAVVLQLAKEYRHITFASVSIFATESSEEDLIHLKLGVSDYKLPALAIAAPRGQGSVVYNQMDPISLERGRAFLDRFLQTPDAQVCRIDGWASDITRSSKELKDYRVYRDEMKERIYDESRSVQEVSEQAYRSTERVTEKDVLTLYTARWCLHSLHFEQLVQEIITDGDIEDILEDIDIVVVDVVTDPPFKANKIDVVPSLRYMPARYKTVPFYFKGQLDSKEAIVEWIRAYHTIRYVEIPGVGKTPFARRSAVPDEMKGEEWLRDINADSGLVLDLDNIYSLGHASE